MKHSISDDDLCATCDHCDYNPGENSGCRKEADAEWPGKQDEDLYFIRCDLYENLLTKRADDPERARSRIRINGS